MKSFIGDEGYQAPRSPRLTEQEVYMVNYVVPVPPVSTVLSGLSEPYLDREGRAPALLSFPFSVKRTNLF